MSELDLPITGDNFSFCWQESPRYTSPILKLQDNRHEKFSPIYIDFLDLLQQFKRQSGMGKNQLIARAVGFKNRGLKVFDATAGLGKDAFLLRYLGCEVTAFESSPVIFALLKNAVVRAKEVSELQPLMDGLDFKLGNSLEVLKALEPDQFPQVVYLDPMYPDLSKTSLAKKEMQILRELIGGADNSEALLEVSLLRAQQRVVIKRPLKAKKIMGPIIHSYVGRAARYDCYSRRIYD